MAEDLLVDPVALREEVRAKYREVAVTPEVEFHFHTGGDHALAMGYAPELVDAVPEEAVESFAGVANPFSAGPIAAGSRVLDIGSGAGFDSFVAAHMVGPEGRVVGVDMTLEMLDKARRAAARSGITNVEFREGLAEDLPVEDGWADVVISNGVINLVVDKQRAFAEIWRSLRAGGVIQFADIANGVPVPIEAMRDIDLWSG
ncbi:MAG: methyltransferase domain-containing protein [Acidimicrobiia bacterium]|nr:methyltransferase domain-containing protein [Acidimicrobiia bacterium]